MANRLAIGCVAVLAWGGAAVADLVYFAGGGRAQLPATIEGDSARLDTPDGPKVFPLGDFRAIVPGHRPEREWPDRRRAADEVGTAPARFSAAWWALENGLTGEAVALLGDLRPGSAGHGPSRRAVAMLDALALPCPDPALEPLRARLRPHLFREIRSRHVVLLHQAEDADARERLDVLQRVVETFYLALAGQGLDLPTPRHRLVSVWFAEQRDYVAFLRGAEAVPFDDTQGYYHPTLRAVFAFDARSAEEHRAGRRAIANRRKDGASPSELDRRSLLLDLEWRAIDLGIAAHETVHHLTAESGLAPRFDDFPLWLHEGFAAQFEVVRGGRWAGFGHVHDLRLPDWRSIQPAPRLAPLLRDVGFGQGYRRDLYAESWALVYFLRKSRPREFLTFLDLLRVPAPDPSDHPGRSLEAFRAAFGDDLGALEADWHRFMDGLTTPLEAGQAVGGRAGST